MDQARTSPPARAIRRDYTTNTDASDFLLTAELHDALGDHFTAAVLLLESDIAVLSGRMRYHINYCTIGP